MSRVLEYAGAAKKKPLVAKLVTLTVLTAYPFWLATFVSSESDYFVFYLIPWHVAGGILPWPYVLGGRFWFWALLIAVLCDIALLFWFTALLFRWYLIAQSSMTSAA